MVIRLLGLALALLALAVPDVRAQCAPINGTGCLVVRPPGCPQPPRINTRMSIACPACATGTPMLIAGTQLTVFVTLQPPLACDRFGCILACQPLVFLPAAGVQIDIPNDPALVGRSICVQCGCVERAPCVGLTQALTVTVQP
jgi:hypothetical protein